jgi:diaminohydroxyphosphoribosylaminopyrimidine deaminase/5-amino-6-(5-phosphoribosylamino)uracil reductase
MMRCLQLARLGAGRVSPNPMVGAVLVHNQRILSEGYHQEYGGPHAEINCLNKVKSEDRLLIPESTLYVNLEPCSHFGKTPPCADRLIQEKIRRVVIGCRDPFPLVDGKGIGKLQDAGIEVIQDVCVDEARDLNRRFFVFHTLQRPYIVLKWAQTADGFIGLPGEKTQISQPTTQRLVHRWRCEEDAILVGSQTALVDNPQLTNRYWSGSSPVRIVLDSHARVPATHRVSDGQVPTIFFTRNRHQFSGNTEYVALNPAEPSLSQLLKELYSRGIQSLLIEGGRTVLQSFADEGLWDEARIIRSTTFLLEKGIPAPVLTNAIVHKETAYDEGDAIIEMRPRTTHPNV